MILIADSGSSKTHWKLQMENEILDFYSLGINPFFATEEFIHSELNHSGLGAYKEKIHKIIFYGSGCSSEERNRYVSDIFRKYFPNTEDIYIDHDMKAASIALFGNEKGIACIIGTGSNSCVWNGHDITANVPALGYILGDEASGASIGKELLKHYIYHTLPMEISDYIRREYQIDKEDIFEAVYQKPLPNRYLAQYAKVATEYRDTRFVQEIIHKGFRDFVSYHIACYPESKTYPIGAVGSIASVFRREFEVALSEVNLTLSMVVKDPIDNLVRYHLGNAKSAEG